MAMESTGVAVTPSDTVDDPNGPFTSLWVGAAGAVVIFPHAGGSYTLPGVLAGTMLNGLRVRRVGSTGTTVTSPATNIVGFK